jgi:hypothetical protein
MDNKSKIELAVNVAIAGILVVYMVSMNPTSYVYIRNEARRVRWWLWSNTTAGWLREALQVRGFTP